MYLNIEEKRKIQNNLKSFNAIKKQNIFIIKALTIALDW